MTRLKRKPGCTKSENLRDPSHHRFLTPRAWKELCFAAGLVVRWTDIHLKKQPDLRWYFETAATSKENQRRVLQLIETAPASARPRLQARNRGGQDRLAMADANLGCAKGRSLTPRAPTPCFMKHPSALRRLRKSFTYLEPKRDE